MPVARPTASTLLAGCLVLIALASTRAGAEGKFERSTFNFSGQVSDLITEDLNGDGLDDLIAIHIDQATRPAKRTLAIIFQTKEKGFAGAAPLEWPLPAEVAAIDVGDVAGSPGRELVFITEKGVFYSSVSGGQVSPLQLMFEVQSVVAIASKDEAPYYNFVRDLDGDKKDDVLVCGFYDSVLARQGEAYAFSQQRINLRPDIGIHAFDISALMVSPESQTFRVSYQAPRIFSEDTNGDGRRDLLASFRDEILVFEQTADGFSPDPAKRWRLALLPENTGRRDRGPGPTIDFADIDGDGKADMVANEMAGRIGEMKSRSVLFWGKGQGLSSGTPDREFKTRQPVMGKIIVWDVNGDKLPDLIMPTYDISAWNLGKILFAGEINVEWIYFLQRPDHTFADAPDRTITTDMKINLKKFRLESGIPNVIADFNGDGYPDQALGESEEVLVITLRDQNGNPIEPVEKINVPVAMFFRAADLNRDGRSDIVMYYLENEERKGEVNLLLNRGPWTEKAK